MVLAMVFACINVVFNISKYMLSVCTIHKQLVYIVHIVKAYSLCVYLCCVSVLAGLYMCKYIILCFNHVYVHARVCVV